MNNYTFIDNDAAKTSYIGVSEEYLKEQGFSDDRISEIKKITEEAQEHIAIRSTQANMLDVAFSHPSVAERDTWPVQKEWVIKYELGGDSKKEVLPLLRLAATGITPDTQNIKISKEETVAIDKLISSIKRNSISGEYLVAASIFYRNHQKNMLRGDNDKVVTTDGVSPDGIMRKVMAFLKTGL